MAHSHNLNITLSDDAVQFVRSKVSSGEYASESDVINESLEALKQEASEFEHWLKDVGGPRYDSFHANPASGIPIDQVERNLEQRRKQRAKARP
jgi:antitoxin ParD1/3/4